MRLGNGKIKGGGGWGEGEMNDELRSKLAGPFLVETSKLCLDDKKANKHGLLFS